MAEKAVQGIHPSKRRRKKLKRTLEIHTAFMIPRSRLADQRRKRGGANKTMYIRIHNNITVYRQASPLVSLKTMNPKEMAGREREGLAGCSSGIKSGRSVSFTSCRVCPFNCTAVLVRLPVGGESQNTSLLLEASSLFSRSADTEEKFIFRSSNTTLPAG